MKNNRIITLFTIALILTFFGSVFAQTDPMERKIPIQLPTRLILPLAYNIPRAGNDLNIVVSSGPFDNTKLNTLQSFAETDASSNPRNPLNIICGDNRCVIAADNLFCTTDGGVNWQIISTIISAGDPVFTHDSLGNGYYIVMTPPLNPTGFTTFKSTNGGLNWISMSSVSLSSAFDKEWVCGDQTAGPFTNYLYLSYSDFIQPVRIIFLRSIDGGVSWGVPQILFGPGNAQGSNIAVGATGRVYVSWYSTGGTIMKYSTDGGLTFSSQVTVSVHSEPGSVHTSGRYVLKGDIRVNGFAQLAADISTGPYRGNVYSAYAGNPPGPDAADIFITKSTDNGVTWSYTSPVRVNDDATLYDQWMTDISVDNLGRVWVMWWDSRNDTNNLWTETYAAVSTNGGQSFMPNFKVSNQRFNPAFVKISQTTHSYLGDYQGMSGKTITYPVWADGREATGGGQSQLLREFTAYLPDYGIAFSKPFDSAAQGGTTTNIVRLPLMGPMTGTVNFTSSVAPSPSPGTIALNFTPANNVNFSGTADSLNLTAVVSSNVPTATYTVTVSGSETGPRSHTRTYALVVSEAIGISGNQNEIPREFGLGQNYPNPFNPTTSFKIYIAKTSDTRIKLYDLSGKEIRSLLEARFDAGTYEFNFDAGELPSGVYFYRMQAGTFSASKKLVLIK